MVVALLVAVGAGYFYFHRPPSVTDKDFIVITDFTNTTADKVFVYLKDITKGKVMDLPEARQHLDQKSCRYIPHIYARAAGRESRD